MLGIAVTVGALFYYQRIVDRPDDIDADGVPEIVELAEEVERLESQLATVEDARVPPPETPNADISTLREMSEGLDDRLSAIEASVVESPGRALELPLLRAELEDLDERVTLSREDAQSSVDDVRNLVYVSVGGIVISLAGLLVSTYLSGRKEKGVNESS